MDSDSDSSSSDEDEGIGPSSGPFKVLEFYNEGSIDLVSGLWELNWQLLQTQRKSP
jgi:hypothetical protein